MIASPGDELWPARSTDGHEIACTRQLGDALDIRIVRATETGSNPAVTTVENGRWPRWSPAGRQLAFFSRRDTNGLDDEVYVIDWRSGDPACLTSREAFDAYSEKKGRLVPRL